MSGIHVRVAAAALIFTAIACAEKTLEPAVALSPRFTIQVTATARRTPDAQQLWVVAAYFRPPLPGDAPDDTAYVLDTARVNVTGGPQQINLKIDLTTCLADPARHGGKTYPLVGAERIGMLELNRRIAAAQRRGRVLWPVPDAVSGAFAMLTGWLPGAPLSADQWALLKAGNVLEGENGMKALGVTPRPLGLFLDRWMVRDRKHGRFGTKIAAPR
jgi:hypothetical protein